MSDSRHCPRCGHELVPELSPDEGWCFYHGTVFVGEIVTPLPKSKKYIKKRIRERLRDHAEARRAAS